MSDREQRNLGVYTIYDTAAKDIGPVFTALTLAVAIRMFHMTIKDSGFPQEFELWRLGNLVVYDIGHEERRIETKLIDLFEVVCLGSDYVSELNRRSKDESR